MLIGDDESLVFYSTLAMSEVCLDVRLGREETSPRALHNLSNTYRCLGQSLQKYGTSAISVVATVMNLALHEDFRGQPSRSAVHIDALQQMVDSHGGIAQFQAPQELLHKICRYRYGLKFHAIAWSRADYVMQGRH